MKQDSEVDVLNGLSFKEQAELIQIDLNAFYDELKILSFLLAYLDNAYAQTHELLGVPSNVSQEQGKRDFQELLKDYAFSWQSASSGTVGTAISRLVGQGFMPETPKFESLPNADKPLSQVSEEERSKWKEYVHQTHEDGKYTIQAHVIFLAQTPELIKNEGYMNPHRLNFGVEEFGYKAIENIAANWEFTISLDELKNRILFIEEERRRLSKLRDETLDKHFTDEERREAQRKILRGLASKKQ
jgi:hypothetical protein